MPNIIESEIREAFSVPEEVELNNADTESQWECFHRMYVKTPLMYSDVNMALIREGTE